MNTAYLVIAGLLLLVVIFFAFKLIMKPAALLGKLIINSLIGLVLLLVVNYFGARFGIVLPVNIITILIAGFLGIPGIILLICFKMIMP